MSLNLTQTATERQSIQSNAISYFAGSPEYQADQATTMNNMMLEITNNTANAISQWCSCNNYKDFMAQESSLRVNAGFIDANVLATWEADLTAAGYLVQINYGNITGNAEMLAWYENNPKIHFATDTEMVISLN